MDFPEFYKELGAEFFGAGAKLMGLQLLQLELRLGKNPSRIFRPIKSAKILWQFWASSSFGVSLAHDGSWSKWEPSLWLCGETLAEAKDGTKQPARPLFLWLQMSCVPYGLRIAQTAATQTTNNNSIRNEQKLHYLEEALPKAPPATTTAAVRNAYTRRVAKQQEVSCLMLVSMTLKIQKNLEDRPAFEILQELKTMFQQQAEQELFEIVKAFHTCKQEEG
ncbi:hypothetical protein Tco_0316631 [Tanacetum coccineum]